MRKVYPSIQNRIRQSLAFALFVFVLLCSASLTAQTVYSGNFSLSGSSSTQNIGATVNLSRSVLFFNVIGTSSDVGSANGAPTAPAITTSEANSTVIFIAGNKKDLVFTGTTPSRTQQYNFTASDLTTYLGTFTQATAGSTGNSATTFSTGDSWSAMHLGFNSGNSADPNFVNIFLI
jgi:hypothetical protein